MDFKNHNKPDNFFSRNKLYAGMRASKKAKRVLAYLIILISATILACSPKTGRGVLKFFFDGVPENKSTDTAAITIVRPDTIKKIAASGNEVSDPLVYYHPPFKERACLKCHIGDVPGKSVYSQDEFCYTCHKDYQKQYKFVHGPVAGGFCTACHEPHLSSNKKLLKNRGQDICLNCHTPDYVMKNENHADIGKASCTECHNPHGGSDRYLSN